MSALPSPAAPAQTPVPLEDLARRIAREMRVAASIADDCQDAIGDEGVEMSYETTVRLQGLDLLSQQLVELGRLLDRLASDGIDGRAAPDALDGVCLSDLKQRLAGVTVDAVAPAEAEVW